MRERGTRMVGDEKRDGRGENDADKAAVNRRRDVSAPLLPLSPCSVPCDFPTTRNNFIPTTMDKMRFPSPRYYVFFFFPPPPAAGGIRKSLKFFPIAATSRILNAPPFSSTPDLAIPLFVYSVDD